MTDIEKMKRRAIYGVAIGDAIGVPYEFRQRDSFVCTDMDGFGTYKKPAGTWSDDTSMTLATEDSIKARGGKIDVKDMSTRFSGWYFFDDYTVDGTFDVGNTTSAAICSGKPGRRECDNGNGSLMRMIPLVFAGCTDDEIRAVSAITHGHQIAQEACVIYVHIARALLCGMSLEEAINALTLTEPFMRLRILHALKREDICSDGYVVHTLEAALWCLMNSHSFRETILTAVNLGLDTDTTAAVAGGLAGIIYGVDREWYAKLRGKSLIDGILEVE